jgi:hypothetical protein
MTKAVCVACQHAIDASARVCPYCGADPTSGQKPVDTQAILQEVFRPRTITTSESVLEYARQRQGIVIAVAIAVVFLILTGLHQFVTARNESSVSGAPAVPLTEITDLSNQPDETKPVPMPDLDFQYDGKPQVMRTFIVEPGAVTPPEVVAAQQAAQQAAQPGVQPPARPGQPAPQPQARPQTSAVAAPAPPPSATQ